MRGVTDENAGRRNAAPYRGNTSVTFTAACYARHFKNLSANPKLFIC
jgi:hypothetical protein